MTLLDNEASSTGKSHLSKKLLVKDKLFSKITFSSAKRGVVELATNTNQDNIVSVAQSGVIMIKDPDKGGGGLTNGHLGELPLEVINFRYQHLFSVSSSSISSISSKMVDLSHSSDLELGQLFSLGGLSFCCQSCRKTLRPTRRENGFDSNRVLRPWRSMLFVGHLHCRKIWAQSWTSYWRSPDRHWYVNDL